MKYLYLRRLCQFLCAAMVIYIIWETRYPADRSINARYIFHIDPLVMFMTAISERLLIAGLITASVTLLLTLLLGRFFCGWICPLGASMDFLSMLLKPVYRLMRIRPAETGPGRARFSRYMVLFVIFGFAVFGVQIAWILDPVTLFFRAFSMNIHPFLTRSIDNMFITLLRVSDFNPFIENVHVSLSNSILGPSVPRFPHADVILALFIVSVFTAALKRRWWCRYVCPLGALLSLPARFSPFTRTVKSCRSGCSLCRHNCRTGAIRQDNSYVREECILCLDCIVFCPGQESFFSFKRSHREIEPEASEKITRSRFLKLIFILLAPGIPVPGRGNTKASGTEKRGELIRPPGSLDEHEFIQRCIRCGNCMKVCPTNVLQPALLEAGAAGVWTPFLDTGIGYCEYNCNLCGSVCPTGAIKNITLAEKRVTKIGLAVINKELCLPWAKQENCIVCEEHCPTTEKAILLREKKLQSGRIIRLPVIDPGLCIGCAICEFKCPTEPDRAVTVKITRSK